MIHCIDSTLSTFKRLKFHPGLNILLSKKSFSNKTQETRNKTGKTSLVELIHFVISGNVESGSIFKSARLRKHYFNVDFDFGNTRIKVSRKGLKPYDLLLYPNNKRGLFGDSIYDEVSSRLWIEKLGIVFFRLSEIDKNQGQSPNFKILFEYYARREANDAFRDPQYVFKNQKKSDYQIALMYLLGLDWSIASEWQQLRELEKDLRSLKRATKSYSLIGGLMDETTDLMTEVKTKQNLISRRKGDLAELKILPQYREMENELRNIDKNLSIIANQLTIEKGSLDDLKASIKIETPPTLPKIKELYAEAGVSLPDLTLKRYEEVKSFHDSIIRNRQNYLENEISSIVERIISMEKARDNYEKRRVQILNVLKAHGALDQFISLQEEISRDEAAIEYLKKRLEDLQKIDNLHASIPAKQNALLNKLNNELAFNKELLQEMYSIFKEISSALYSSGWSVRLEGTEDGPEFVTYAQGSRSSSIKSMIIFCFDLMLMVISSKNNLGPGFLIHDSAIFNVDGRQIVKALKIGAELSKKYGFQYIVAMNDDDVFKEETIDFNIEDHLLPVSLTDSIDGGLFGFQF